MYGCHWIFNWVGMSLKSSSIHCYLRKRHCPLAMLSDHVNACTTGIMEPNTCNLKFNVTRTVCWGEILGLVQKNFQPQNINSQHRTWNSGYLFVFLLLKTWNNTFYHDIGHLSHGHINPKNFFSNPRTVIVNMLCSWMKIMPHIYMDLRNPSFLIIASGHRWEREMNRQKSEPLVNYISWLSPANQKAYHKHWIKENDIN